MTATTSRAPGALVPARSIPRPPSPQPPTVRTGVAAVVAVVGAFLESARRSATGTITRHGARPARILVIVPAHNEEDSIGACLDALTRQTRRPDKIVVAADNCDDRTAAIAARYKGVTVFSTVANEDRKVGALTQAWQRYADGYEYIVGVDADTVLAPDCIGQLEAEMAKSPGVGGLMARYTFDQAAGTTAAGRLLLRLQRFEFTGWTVDILRRRRRTYVLGGQATMFRAEALAEVTATKRRYGPWDPTAQVEDMELTWSLNSTGWETKVSRTARAYVGPMLTLRSFWAQRRKWDEGMIRLLLASGISRTTLYPWRVQAKMALDLLVRVLFVLLTSVSLAGGAYRWYWIWALPPAIAVLVNLRTLARMPHRRPADTIAALTLVPIELYLWLRLAVWTASWITVLAGVRRDGWARQYAAEGKRALAAA